MYEMHIRNLDLNLLVVMDAMLRERNVSKAAERIGLTQSAMSHALNRLRHYFDDPLFVKAGPAMEPTAKAMALQAAVLDVMGTVRQRILSEAHFDPATAQREFTLCVTDMGELVFIPTLLALMRKLAPLCSIRTLQVPAHRPVHAVEQGLRPAARQLEQRGKAVNEVAQLIDGQWQVKKAIMSRSARVLMEGWVRVPAC